MANTKSDNFETFFAVFNFPQIENTIFILTLNLKVLCRQKNRL